MTETPPAPSTEQLLVQLLLRSLNDALTSGRGEGALASQPDQAREAVSLAFVSLSNRIPWLTIDVTSEGLVWGEIAVLRWGEGSDDLIALLEAADIERIDMVRGAEAELPAFLAAIERTTAPDSEAETTLKTLLFREDLQYIRCAISTSSTEARPRAATEPEPTAVSESTTPTPIEPVSVLAAVRAEASAHRPVEAGGVPLDADSSLYFLDADEIAYLREAIQREYESDHAQSVVEMLLDVIESQTDRRTRDEALGVVRTLLPYLLGQGRFDCVAYLTAELRSLGRRIELEPDHRKAIEALRTSVSETRALAQLFHALDTERLHPSDADLAALLGELRPEAIGTVLVWVSQLENRAAKAVVRDALRSFFTQWPHSLSLLLEASDRTVVHRALGIAEALALPDLADPISKALETDDPVTRLRAVRALSAIGTPNAIRAVVPLVNDPDEDVRLRVFEELAGRPVRGSLGPLQGALASPELEDRDVGERRALMRAYASASGPSGVATLETILNGRSGLARRPSSETRACAAVALGTLSTPSARHALIKATSDRDPVVRSAANSTLRSLE